MIFPSRFSGRRYGISPVCVCLSVSALTAELETQYLVEATLNKMLVEVGRSWSKRY